MQKLLFGCLCLISFQAMSQTDRLLSNTDGLEISYRSQKLEEGGSKDKYLVNVTAVNNNKYALFYGVRASKGSNGLVSVDGLSFNSVAKVVVRNSVGFLAASDVPVRGEQTSLYADNQQQVLFKFEAGRTYHYEQTFHVKHGDTLVVTFSNNTSLKDIHNFNLDVTQASLEGVFKTSCGGANFNLTYHTDYTTNKSYLIQTVNGRQIKWFKTSELTFIRDYDNSTTITFDKSRGEYLYSNMDGTSCEWFKP